MVFSSKMVTCLKISTWKWKKIATNPAASIKIFMIFSTFLWTPNLTNVCLKDIATRLKEMSKFTYHDFEKGGKYSYADFWQTSHYFVPFFTQPLTVSITNNLRIRSTEIWKFKFLSTLAPFECEGGTPEWGTRKWNHPHFETGWAFFSPAPVQNLFVTLSDTYGARILSMR